jgi:hypothetical protein
MKDDFCTWKTERGERITSGLIFWKESYGNVWWVVLAQDHLCWKVMILAVLNHKGLLDRCMCWDRIFKKECYVTDGL